jgi:hypothetical protein
MEDGIGPPGSRQAVTVAARQDARLARPSRFRLVPSDCRWTRANTRQRCFPDYSCDESAKQSCGCCLLATVATPSGSVSLTGNLWKR